MGLRKYRSIEEMPAHPPREPLDPENLRIAAGLMDLGRRLAPAVIQPGLRKFRSWDDLVRGREQRETQQAADRAGNTIPPRVRVATT